MTSRPGVCMGSQPSGGEPERARWPRLAAESRPPLRPLLPRGYAGYTEATAPRHRIANEVGWSHRHFIARFRQQVGLAPKSAARLVRFDGVWRRLDQRTLLDWADIARDAGYADQAHLIRDFRQFTGTTPADLARTLPPRPDGQGQDEVNSVQYRAAVSS